MVILSTICAISTPLAVGGISVIRISGENAIDIAEKLFVPANGKPVCKMEGNTCAYGRIFSDGETLDDGVLTVFRAPKSYTGENVAEISCHGGIYITRRVLRACIASGAVPAQAGEFTKRAFLNGKMSLTQAESVMELISANGEQALRSANSVREGRLFQQIKAVSDRLVAILSDLAAWNDYPEEDLPSVENGSLAASLREVRETLNSVTADYDSGRILRNGADTAIVGRPNVGKSTLMNSLLGYNRSIVTDIAGTTRDIVEESANIGGILLRLSDTAGLRKGGGEVEGIGIELAKRKLAECDIAFAVFDGSSPLSGDDRELLAMLDCEKTVILLNKCDLGEILTESDVGGFRYILRICAKSGAGLEGLGDILADIFKLNRFDSSSAMFANERQKLCCDKASDRIDQAIQALRSGETLDAVTILIDKAADSLLELTGEKATEAVVNKVFERFCVGK